MTERQTRLEAILASAVDAIIVIDEMGIIASLNPAAVRLFGYEAAEMLGQNVSMLMPAPYHSQHDKYLSNFRETRQPKIIGIGREVVAKRKDGSTFAVHLAVSEFHDNDRRMFTGIVRDISDLKTAQLQLEQLNAKLEHHVQEQTLQLREAENELIRRERLATLGQVSGGIAHEIRNPLNAIKTSAYFLLNTQSLTESKLREHLERIDRQVTMIDEVITALSDVVRMPDPQLQPLSIVPLVEGTLAQLDIPSAIQIVRDVPTSLPQIFGDDGQLRIVFTNLIKNACDAMPQGGKLTVTFEPIDSVVNVRIRDTGVGISPEDLPRIMEPLYSTKVRGMGLGLAISRVVLHKNLARLDVSSQVGVGSEFTVVLAAVQ